MGQCQHRFPSDREPCPHPAPAGAEFCLWHNRQVVKDQAYVAQLLAASIEATAGDLEHTALASLDWPNARLAGVRLAESDLHDAVLIGADLSGADLSGCNLRRTDLRRANLQGAVLRQADLTDTQLSDADLRSADLSGAHLCRTVLLGTDLRNACLKDAVVEEFLWNRLTRFSQIRGLEPRGGTSDSDATQRFITPAALGAIDLPDHERLSQRGRDPELQRTRRFSMSGLTGPAPTTPSQPPSSAPRTIPPPPPSSSTPPTHLPRRRERLLMVLAGCSLVLALGALSLLGWDKLRLRTAATHTVAVPTTDPALKTDRDRLQKEQERLHRELTSAQAHIGELEQQKTSWERGTEQLRSKISLLTDELQRIRLEPTLGHITAYDPTLSERLTRVQTELEQQKIENSRLRRTAAIMADGVTRLREDNTSLSKLRDEQLVIRTRVTDLENQLTQRDRQASEAQTQAESAKAQSARLQRELQVAYQAMAAITQRVQGTQLENLLGQSENKEPLLALEPGKPVTVGGEYLVTLTLVPDSKAGTVDCQIVLQAPPRRPVPDLAVILYDAEERARRKVTFGFLGERTPNGFAMANSVIPLREFPTSARILLAATEGTASTAMLPGEAKDVR